MDRSRRRATGVRPLLAACLVLVLSACGSGAPEQPSAGRPSTSTAPEDAAVEVVGLPEGTEVTVEDTSGGTEGGENLDFVSPLYTLGPEGGLENPVTVRLQLDNALPTTATVVVASRDSEDEPYTFSRGYLTTDHQHVQFTTRKLNQVGVLSVDVAGASDSLRSDVLEGLTAGVSSTVERQDCEGSDDARQDEYSAAGSGQTLYWCFGMQDGRRVVQLTNRRRVPVQVTHAGVPVVESPRAVAAWAPWMGPLGLEATFLPPGQTVTYDAELEPRSRLVLTTSSGRAAQSLRLLRATTRALVSRLEAFGVAAPDAAATLGAVLALPSCKRSLSRGGAALVAGCLGPAQLARLFDTAQLLVAPLVTDSTFGPFLRDQAAAVATSVRSQERQRVVVRRGAPAFDAFTGGWSGKSRSLAIDATGVVTESFYREAQLVISLTYRLSDPTTKGASASADAVITRVEVGDRDLLAGRVPQVGDRGVLRIADGVLTPPYLRTTYCSPAKQKSCAG